MQRLYLACPRCDRSTAYPLDDRLGVAGFLSPQAQRLLCLAGASWSFDRAAANLQEFGGLTVCDNVIREACHQPGGLLRQWQREDPAASAAFRATDGDVEFQTDGTMVNSCAGWREMRLSIFAKRRRGKAVTGRDHWQQRNLPAPHVRVIEAGVRSSEQWGPAWRRMAARLGLRQTADITAIADGARWIWRQLDKHLPGVAGVLDISHASQQLWAAAHQQLGEDSAEARAWVEGRRATLLREGVSGLREELSGAEWSGVRGYFEPHGDHSDYAGRLTLGQSIGSGMVEGACKQVIGRRLKQTGARWKVRRVERMATRCAVQASSQWDTYWSKAAERST